MHRTIVQCKPVMRLFEWSTDNIRNDLILK